MYANSYSSTSKGYKFSAFYTHILYKTMKKDDTKFFHILTIFEIVLNRKGITQSPGRILCSLSSVHALYLFYTIYQMLSRKKKLSFFGLGMHPLQKYISNTRNENDTYSEYANSRNIGNFFVQRIFYFHFHIILFFFA